MGVGVGSMPSPLGQDQGRLPSPITLSKSDSYGGGTEDV
jgi:hypothetical protein